MIIGNYSTLAKSPGRFLSGQTASGDRSNFGHAGGVNNRFMVDNSYSFASFSALPNGYLHPYAWSLPKTPGGMATYKSVIASFNLGTTNLAAGKALDVTITSTFNITNAQLDQIVSLIASISASVNVTNAQLAAVASIQASITATGTITNAQLGAIVSLATSLGASISSNLDIFATANISADIGGATPLSPEGLANAVWATQLASYTTAGSAGKKLNDLSGGGGSSPEAIAEAVWVDDRALTKIKFLALK